MKKILFVLSLLMATNFLFAETVWKVLSPNGEHSIEVQQDSIGSDDFSYTITTKGLQPIVDSELSIDVIGNSEDFIVSRVVKNSKNELLNVDVPNYASKIIDSYNERKIFFKNGLMLNLRAYNNGVAFRWQSTQNSEMLIEQEEIDFNFAKDYLTYYPKPEAPAYFSHHENVYEAKHLSELTEKEISPVPLLVELDDDKILMISDINLQNYPGMWLSPATKGETRLAASFPPYPQKEKLEGDRNLKVAKAEDFIAKIPAFGQTSWKAFLMGDKSALFNPTLFYCLADESKIEDDSWIKPGLVVWDWWNALNFTDAGFKGGVDQRSYQYNIDFAAENGIPYVILDEGWSVPGPENLLQVVKEIDMPALSAYAKSKGVGLILWMTSVALEMNYDKAFDQFKEWGIKGLKIDFLQRDDQRMMDFCYKTAAKAAEYEMLVDYHGGSKPAGITRTYPNVITIESVQGLEQNKWGYRANPKMAVYNAYIRMAVGPMDYTPGAMKNKQKALFVPNFTSPSSQGTRCHQMAMYIVYLSPLQMFSDTACSYRNNAECFDALKTVPVTWDESLFLGGKIGESVAVARRSGKNWYVGALTDWNARNLTVKLGFLPDGKYEVTEFVDGRGAKLNGSRYEKRTKMIEIKNGLVENSIEIKMVKGGGYFAKFKLIE